MRTTIDLLVGIIASVIFLSVLIPLFLMASIIIHACDDENLETKVITVKNKFITRTGFLGSSDAYHFLDKNGIDYAIWGGHCAARYVKLKLNQSYHIKVNVENGNLSCEEILIER